ncbi:hypothetical protein [Paraburkholderia sp. 2C]
MKTESCKLARIATVVCTSVAPLAVAHAQQVEAVAPTTAESAATADAPLAPPHEQSVSASANLPIVDATESDAQCVTDAASAFSVAISYAAPIAVPVHTDTVATMSTPTAAPFLADAQANELGWGKPRSDAMSLADADIAAPARPVPLENAARVGDVGDVGEARDLRDAVREDTDEVSPQGTPRDAALPAAAKPGLLPNVPLPVRKPPVSYAAPVAVPVRAAQSRADADVDASAHSQAAETALSVSDEQKLLPTVVAEADESQGVLVAQADIEPAVAAAPMRHVSYAAPVAVPAHRDRRTPLLPSAEARKGPQPLALVQPFMLMHMNSSDTTAVDMPALPVRLILPPTVTQAATSPAEPPPARLSQATVPQATASKAKPVSYAAPIAVPSHGDSSVAAHRLAPPAAQPQVQPAAQVQTASAGNTDPNWSMPDKLAISDERLDTMRGGFDLSSGLKVSFGISRMVVVNGNLVTTTSFNIPDLANLSAQQAAQLASVNAGSLIQNGPGNVVQPGALPALSGTVIQNTLNNQNIQALTTINTTVNSLSMFKNFNVGSTLGGALTNAVRPR